jgi:hypothetical protein
MIERVNDPAFIPPGGRAAVEELTSQLAAYTANLTGTAQLKESMRLPSPPTPPEGLEPTSPLEEVRSTRREVVETVLAAAIARNPLESTGELRRLHARAEEAEKRFGLVRGPTESGEELSPAKLDEILQSLVGALRGGFSRGRPDDGLDDIIDDFIRVSMNAAENPDPENHAERKRAVLLQSLVQFAEKVLFVTDHASLVDGGAGATRFNITADSLQIQGGGVHVHASDGSLLIQTRNDAHLLQAIGNSILVQVNEIYARENHTEREEAAFSLLTPSATVIKAESDRSPRDVLDRVVFRLEDSLRQEVAANGVSTEKAKNLASAVALANEHRARTIYIRPPSFYLKNSYPVTSFVDNQSQGLWTNMLAQQAGRSVPLLGEHIENPRSRRQTAQLQQEIDRRFWQNINRIRVAGAGRTNYAIVKDAVGNWNVKNFTADPTPIITAAKAAAVVAAGGVPTMLGEGSLPDANAVRGQTDARLERLIESFAQRTREDAAELGEFMGSLPSSVKAGISSDPDAVRISQAVMAVDAAPFFPPHLLEALSAKEAGPDMEEAIVQSLRAVRRYRDTLAAAIATAEPPADASDPGASRRAAQRIIHDRVTRPLRDRVDRRFVSVESHRGALQATHESMENASAVPKSLPNVPGAR